VRGTLWIRADAGKKDLRRGARIAYCQDPRGSLTALSIPQQPARVLLLRWVVQGAVMEELGGIFGPANLG
jgi:hypothetical protein